MKQYHHEGLRLCPTLSTLQKVLRQTALVPQSPDRGATGPSLSCTQARLALTAKALTATLPLHEASSCPPPVFPALIMGILDFKRIPGNQSSSHPEGMAGQWEEQHTQRHISNSITWNPRAKRRLQ